MAIGAHRIEYEVVQGWEQLPEGMAFVEVAGVAVDSRDRVYVFCRGKIPLIVFDREGKFLSAWGEGVFTIPHGIFIDDKDHLFLSDSGDHTLRQFTPEGRLLRTWGKKDQASDTGFALKVSPVQRAAGPFNRLTNAVVLPSGEMYVADGYGNARVHKFGADGVWQFSWGGPGSGPGQFNLPHGIAVDSAGLVYVADRENTRIQIFSPKGEYLREWGWVGRPCDLFIDGRDRIYVAELGFRLYNPTPVHYRFIEHTPAGHEPLARVTICNPDGEIEQRIGGDQGVLPGNFIAPHGIWVDRRGDFYVGEVIAASGAAAKLAPLTCHAFQKFVGRK